MVKKLHLLLFILLLSSIFCFTNTFADQNGEPIDIEKIIAEGNFEFPTADSTAYIQDNAEYEKIPDVIIGEPDFEKMRNLPTDSQDYQLGRKVGLFVILNRSRDGAFICTGFLVGPDLFLTNHHCIHDDAGLLRLGTATAIYMDYYQEREDDPTRGGITARVSALVHADEEKDYALLRLNAPIGDTYGWLELDTDIEPDNTHQSVKLISHSQGRSKEIVRRNSQILGLTPARRDQFPYILAYLADSEGGSSGSPVFLRDGTGVIAIHHSGVSNRQTGEPLYNIGTLMSHIVPEIQQYLPTYMYWTDSGTDTIQRVNLGGSNVQDIVTTGLRTPTDIAVNLTAEKLYWTDSGTDTIQGADLNGANIEDIVTTGLRTPKGIVVDTFAGNLYWADSGTDTIQRANLDGSNVQDIVTTGLRTPTGIAIDAYDPNLGKIYWTDSGTDKIQRANLDGSNITDLVTEGLRTPTSIALGLVAGKLYWTDSGTDKIQRANLDGSNIEDIVTTGLRTPNGIAVDPEAGKIYWVDAGTDKIQRANLDGSNIEDIVTTGLRTPTGIALAIPQIVSANPPPEPPGPGPGPGTDPGSVDVNGDGEVTVIDLAIVALSYGIRVPDGLSLPADVNDDKIVDLSDLTAVAQAIDAAGNAGTFAADDLDAVLEVVEEQANAIEEIPEAPGRFNTSQRARFSGFAYQNVAAAFADAKHFATDDVHLGKWMPLLKELLHLLAEMQEIPDTTTLLPNYPNPFNPETWIPYHLSKDAEVTLTIHDVSGSTVRSLTLGHQPAGIYQSKHRAAYWDGRNGSGEPVASGVYFYTLTAGEFTATRKLLIIK